MSYQETQDQMATAYKQRKSSEDFKIRRKQLRLIRFQSTVTNGNGNERTNDYEILQKVNKNTCETELNQYQKLMTPSAVRPPLKKYSLIP